jgi:hypothetical protein
MDDVLNFVFIISFCLNVFFVTILYKIYHYKSKVSDKRKYVVIQVGIKSSTINNGCVNNIYIVIKFGYAKSKDDAILAYNKLNELDDCSKSSLYVMDLQYVLDNFYNNF